MCDGEDYELLIAAEPGFEGAWAAEFPELQITEIGRLVAGNPVAPEEFDGGGWDPFQKS